mmetsp:Transcript_15692/g.54698  ORF Transcript_15692/g.54698 Transcript_15692/m.54698 type:complete len:568 (+) Transcript_15692:141-1844(+)
MPLVVEFLLLDEDAALLADGVSQRVPTGQGIFAEIERQLSDQNSHLRRKSAFGALVTRGAVVRAIGHEQVEGLHDVGIVRPVSRETLGLAFSERAGAALPPLGPDCGDDDAPLNERVAAGGAGQGIAVVPKILAFPKPPSRPAGSPSSGFGVVRALFGLLPSCTPACSTVPKQVVDTCTILVPESECMPARAHEAGLGGWPLCVPHAFAAFPPQQQPADGAAALAVAPWGPREGVGQAAVLFRRVAVEVDDFDLTVVCSPHLGPPAASASAPGALGDADPAAVALAAFKESRVQPTASTRASTAINRSISSTPGGGGGRDGDGAGESWPPTWAQHNRLVLSREGICSFQVWPASSLGSCTLPGKFCCNGSPPWSYLVEVTGTPIGAPHAMSILLALPSAALAARVAEALSRVRHRRVPPALAGAPRGSSAPVAKARRAVRCELHINAKANLDAGINSVNCAAVVRRGISEACHVGADRVRICSVRDLAAALQLPPSVAGGSFRGGSASSRASAAGPGAEASAGGHTGVEAAAGGSTGTAATDGAARIGSKGSKCSRGSKGLAAESPL